MTLSSTESEYVALSACAQELNILSMFLGEITKVKKLSVIDEDNLGVMFLANNRQVDISKNHIDIYHHLFLRGMVKKKILISSIS